MQLWYKISSYTCTAMFNNFGATKLSTRGGKIGPIWASKTTPPPPTPPKNPRPGIFWLGMIRGQPLSTYKCKFISFFPFSFRKIDGNIFFFYIDFHMLTHQIIMVCVLWDKFGWVVSISCGKNLMTWITFR